MDYREFWRNEKNVSDLNTAWNMDFMREQRAPAYKLVQNIPEKGMVLDAGCGCLHDLPFFINDGWKYTGLDPSVEMLVYAAKLYPDATLIHDDIVETKLGDNLFDLVYSASVICHMPLELVNIAIGNMMRISKKHLIIYTPYVHDLSTINERAEGYLRNRFNSYDLINRISAVGKIAGIERKDDIIAIHTLKRVKS